MSFGVHLGTFGCHFGAYFLAALGAANCNLELDRIQPALEGYRLALAINPDLDTVRSQIDYLARIAEDRS